MADFPKRGEIFWVCLDPTLGTEVRKTRPGLILSNNLANKHSRRVIIAPITSSISRVFPFEAIVLMPEGKKKVMLDQIRAVDKAHLRDWICSIPTKTLHEVERSLKHALGLS